MSHTCHLTSLDPDITAFILTKCAALSVCLCVRSCLSLHRVGALDQVWADLRTRDEATQLDGRPVEMEGARARYQQHRECIPSRILHQLSGHTDEVLHLAFSHTGELLCTASRDQTAIVWKMGGVSAPAQVAALPLGGVGAWVAWSPDDSLLAVATLLYTGLEIDTLGAAHLHRFVSGNWQQVAEFHSQAYDAWPVFHGDYLLYGCHGEAFMQGSFYAAIANREKESMLDLKVWCTASIGEEGVDSYTIALSLGGPHKLWQKNYYHNPTLSFPDNSAKGHLITLTGTSDLLVDTLAVVPVMEGPLQATGPCSFIQENGALLDLQPIQISGSQSGFIVSVSDGGC